MTADTSCLSSCSSLPSWKQRPPVWLLLQLPVDSWAGGTCKGLLRGWNKGLHTVTMLPHRRPEPLAENYRTKPEQAGKWWTGKWWIHLGVRAHENVLRRGQSQKYKPSRTSRTDYSASLWFTLKETFPLCHGGRNTLLLFHGDQGKNLLSCPSFDP